MVGTNDSTLVFFVNGKKIVEKQINPHWTLLYYFRNKLLLCGTKLGCGEGGCGACTVMISRYDRQLHKVIHLAVNACLMPICAVHGLAVTTVEGIGSTKTKLHPVQECIAKAHGSQCGFCTPGFVMSMYTLLRNSPKPSMRDIETAFQGNLCRCTGYRPIVEGYKTFSGDWSIMQNGNGICAMGDQCCKLQNGHSNGINEEDKGEKRLFKFNEFTPYDPTQEPIFPSELKLYDTLDRQNLKFVGKDVTWFRPISLQELLELKDKYPDAKVVAGNSEVGVEVKFKRCVYPVRIHPKLIPELNNVTSLENCVRIGAAVSLQDVEDALKEQIRLLPTHRTRIFAAMVDMFRWFGGKQIRNVATLAGNIMTASPISDLNQIFVAARVELEVHSKFKGCRKVIMDEHFFKGYRTTSVDNNEVIVAISIAYTNENEYFYAYKQARRREDDIAIVNSAIHVRFEPKSDMIKDINIAFGGMAPTTVTAPKTGKSLIGKSWNRNTLDLACTYLIEDLPLLPSAPGGMVQYRRALTLSFFFKAYLAIFKQLQSSLPLSIDEKEVSAVDELTNGFFKSSQYFQILPTNEKIHSIGQPIAHKSAFQQATGEAVYCDDMLPYPNELYMSLVVSTKAHANILSIDASEALQMEGVHVFYSAKDLPEERNQIGPTKEEVVFVSRTVTAQGQVLGAIVAEDQAAAQAAARKVKIIYEELQPVIVSLEDSIKNQMYFTEFRNPRKIEKGNVDEIFATAPYVIEGDYKTGAQEHFYMETQCTLVVPKGEDDEMEVFCATQYPAAITKIIAGMLGVPQSRIITRVKRMGGGFGGKEQQPIVVAAPAALAASRLNRPVRCMLDRDEDMIITGSRHPFYVRYKTAFDETGKILGSEIHLYNNAGFVADVSEFVMERAMFHCDNAYQIPNIRVVGYVYKTNLPSNTSFRGYGAPQAMLSAEFMIRNISEFLKKDPIEVAKLNLYREGDLTFYNQKLERCTIERCWNECVTSSNLADRAMKVKKYNSENRWKKRGISVTPTKYGISFSALFLNQGAALIHIYTDGSVLLTHGGTEMGQGLHTKMIQIASTTLGIPHTKIHISETSTDKVPNAVLTAGSLSSDLNGMAVLNACETINKRLEPYKKANPKGMWEEWIKAAYFDRVSLSTTGFYKCPFEGYDWETKSGSAYMYFTCGVACSEVEIDCLTGDHRILRTDIVMDIGESINPAIDVGQIEGAFMQGYGLFMLEEVLYAPDGTTLSRGPSTYKLPCLSNIPMEFNVSILKGAPNPRAVYSSKAVGEPPLFLASSVMFATREAIKAARADAGLFETDFTLSVPLTSAKIRMGCQDHITSKLDEPKPGTYVAWNVIP